MRAELRISNYRCFSEERPAVFQIRDGETALVGANNSGKSTLLKFFYEMQPLFSDLVSSRDFLVQILKGGLPGIRTQAYTGDMKNLFYNGNSADITIYVRVDYADYVSGGGSDSFDASNHIMPTELVLTIQGGIPKRGEPKRGVG